MLCFQEYQIDKSDSKIIFHLLYPKRTSKLKQNKYARP